MSLNKCMRCTKGRNEWYSLYFFSSPLSIFHRNSLMPGPFCSLLFFSDSLWLYKARRQKGMAIITSYFDVTAQTNMRGTLDVFSVCKLVLSVLIHHELSCNFFMFDMREKERWKILSYRVVYILDCPLLIQGHHIVLPLASYWFIHFFIERTNYS